MLHHSDSQQPGTLLIPHHMKTHVYCNLVVLNEFPDAKPSVARIIQLFTKQLAIPMTERWRLAFAHARMSFSNPTRTQVIPEDLPLVPSPVESGSLQYVWVAQSPGQLEELLAVVTNPTNQTKVAELQTEVATLKEEINNLKKNKDTQILSLQQQLTVLTGKLNYRNTKITHLRTNGTLYIYLFPYKSH